MDGTVGILNVGAGDTKLSFDPKNPVERVRAARIAPRGVCGPEGRAFVKTHNV